MKHKHYKSEVVDVAEKGIVTISISKFDITDAGGDIVRKGAFTKTFKENNGRIKHVIDHSLKQMSVVGLPLKMYETDTHAIVESALNLEKEIARDLFSDYKFFQANGKTLEHSYGYETMKAKQLPNKGEDILELKMWEYSTIALGMNAETSLLSIKSFEDVTILEEYLRKYDVSNTKAKQIESIIAQIKALSEPESTHATEPSLTLTIKSLNEMLNTKKLY